MSYCRLSSDNWQSDVYCYRSALAYTIHVANARFSFPIPDVDDTAEQAERIAAYKRQERALKRAATVPITLPHAGETFDEPSASACLARLLELRAIGYHVPETALLRLRAESEQP